MGAVVKWGAVKTLPPVNKRAVHILLECFLVINQSSFLRKILEFVILELIVSGTQCISIQTYTISVLALRELQ